jgi:hypothetical protein
MTVISVAPLLAATIQAIETNAPLSKALNSAVEESEESIKELCHKHIH